MNIIDKEVTKVDRQKQVWGELEFLDGAIIRLVDAQKDLEGRLGGVITHPPVETKSGDEEELVPIAARIRACREKVDAAGDFITGLIARLEI